MASIIQIRQDTAANWTSVDPTLHMGEFGLETDTGKTKLGDGTTAWTSLAYYAAGGNVTGPVSSTNQALTIFDDTSGQLLASTAIIVGSNNELSEYLQLEDTDAGTSRTLNATDSQTTINFTANSTVTVTLPNSLPAGFKCKIIQGGTGQVQFTAASGATLQNRYGHTASASTIYSAMTLEVVSNSGGSAAVYNLTGDTGINSAMIKSIQKVTVTIAASATSGTATITSVTTANAFCWWQGSYATTSTFAAEAHLASVTLTNATTVTATRNTSDSGTVVVQVTVVEFNTGIIQSIQQGTVAIGNGATSNTATITSVTQGNAFVMFQGQTFGAATDDTNLARCFGNVVLTNATTVTASRTTASTTTLTVGFVVVEFVAGILQSNSQAVSAAMSSANATITSVTAVDKRYSTLIYGGALSTITTASTGSLPYSLLGGAGQTFSATSVNGCTAKVTVIEFAAANVKSIQRNLLTIVANSASNTQTINSVDTTKSVVNFIGWAASTTQTAADSGWETMTLTNATTVTATRGATHATITLLSSYDVIEFS